MAASGQTRFGMMTYNCENAFDTIHDAGRDDMEFLPGGDRKWTGWKYREKMRNIARVVLAADTVQPVDVVCLCEVENDSVMTHLTERTFLRNIGYKYVMTDSDNERGTDVAVMYMPLTFRLVETQVIPCRGTRDVLRVSGRLLTGDTLDVFAVHLPSKLGGKRADRLRMRIASDVRRSVDSLFASRANPNIVVMGDFNAEPGSRLLDDALGVEYAPCAGVTEADALYQTSRMKDKGFGTYKYKGMWSAIDNILVSGSMWNPSASLRTSSECFRVVDKPFMLEPDKSDKSSKPKRSFMGTFYRGGYSDHLPLYVRFDYLF